MRRWEVERVAKKQFVANKQETKKQVTAERGDWGRHRTDR